ncbi:hypothetical protein LB505_006650 [Fusarium chuoi]|nr:hypothetical protein LB505_006650 [Fusarium chuoi]
MSRRYDSRPLSDTSSLITKTFLANSLCVDFAILSRDTPSTVVYDPSVCLSSTPVGILVDSSSSISATPLATTVAGRLQVRVPTTQAHRVSSSRITRKTAL